MDGFKVGTCTACIVHQLVLAQMDGILVDTYIARMGYQLALAGHGWVISGL